MQPPDAVARSRPTGVRSDSVALDSMQAGRVRENPSGGLARRPHALRSPSMSTEPQQPAVAAPPPSKGKLPLILAAIVVILGVAGAVAFLGGEEPAAHGETEGEHAAPPPSEPGVITLAPFVLNLADQTEDRYLRTTIRIILDRAEEAEKATAEGLEQTRLNDRIFTILSSKSAYEITSFEGKEALRRELHEKLAPLFEHATVTDVLFTEFLVQ